MKTYKERLPEIDKAIFDLGGEWPDDLGEYLVISGGDNTVHGSGVYRVAFKSGHKNTIWDEICTRTEFESRLADWRRLYEWRKDFLSVHTAFTLWIADELFRDTTVMYAKSTGFNWQKSLEEKPDVVITADSFSIYTPDGELKTIDDIIYDGLKKLEEDMEESNPSDYEAHKKNSETLFRLTEFLVNNNIGQVGENCVDVAIREISEKHDVKSERDSLVEQAEREIEEVEPASGQPSLTSQIEVLIDKGWRPTEKVDD